MGLFDMFFEEIPEDENTENTKTENDRKDSYDRGQAGVIEQPSNSIIETDVDEGQSDKAQTDDEGQASETPQPTEEEIKLGELGRAQQEFRYQFQAKVRRHGIISALSMAAMFAISVVVILYFISGVYIAKGDGMSPSITDGEYILINKLAYIRREPQRGDIILVNDNVYRIIGLPGEVIETYGGHVYIDGKIADEQYLENNSSTYSANETTFSPSEGVENGYYVLHDNRSATDDSRSGFVIQKNDIIGKVVAY